MTLTQDQLDALIDAYATLRAIYTHDCVPLVVRRYCTDSASLLVAAFPDLARLEQAADNMESV